MNNLKVVLTELKSLLNAFEILDNYVGDGSNLGSLFFMGNEKQNALRSQMDKIVDDDYSVIYLVSLYMR